MNRTLLTLACLPALLAPTAETKVPDIALYRQYELPLPPTNALLCIHEHGDIRIVNGKRVQYRLLVFALENLPVEKPVRCLVGIQEWTSSPGDRLTPVSPDVSDVRETEPMGFLDGFEFNVDFAMAIQCQARGWDALASYLLERSKTDYRGPACVTHLAWQYWRYQFAKAQENRPQIVQRLKALLKEKSIGTDENKQLVADMETTLARHDATNDVERLIESLVDYSGGDEPIGTLKRAGFDAVPELIEHLDDRRLTREIHPRIMNCPPQHGRISEHMDDILKGVMSKKDHSTLTKKIATDWWENQQRIGEEKYLISKVLPDDKNAEWPATEMVKTIQAKYPKYLPKLYATVLRDYPKMQSHPLADALVDSSLPRETKIKALLPGVEQTMLDRKRTALFGLLKLQYDGVVPLLVKTLDALPITPDGPYWCTVGAFGNLVAMSRSPDAWDAFLRTAKRVDVGSRMEFMNVMDYNCISDTPLAPRVTFLREFMKDTTVRDVATNAEMYEGPCAGFIHKRIAVRDFAAQQLASLFAMKPNADPSWTSGNWDHLRKQVEAKLKEYDLANQRTDSERK